MSNVLQTSNLFSISSSYIIWPHFFGYNSDSMEYKTLKFPMLCCSYFINSSQVLVSFHTFLGKCDLNNTVVSASFEKPSYNPVFAIITYTFRTVFVLLGQACLMRTSISLPLMFKDHVHTRVTIHILSLFYLQFAHYLVAMKSMETVVFSCSTRQTLIFPPVLFCLLYYVSATLSSKIFSAKIPYRLQNSFHQCFIFQLCCTVFCKRIF